MISEMKRDSFIETYIFRDCLHTMTDLTDLRRGPDQFLSIGRASGQ